MNNYQITLFFAKDTTYKSIEISNSMMEKIAMLGEPTVLPSNMAMPKEANFPIIIFNKNSKIQINMNYSSMVLNIVQDDNMEIKDLILDINNVLEEHNVKVVRIGYGYKTQLERSLIQKFKIKNFIEEELKESISFELSWLTEININKLNVNCWQRYYTELNSEYLNVIFDINTKADEENEINNSFLDGFIRESEVFIAQKMCK